MKDRTKQCGDSRPRLSVERRSTRVERHRGNVAAPENVEERRFSAASANRNILGFSPCGRLTRKYGDRHDQEFQPRSGGLREPGTEVPG